MVPQAKRKYFGTDVLNQRFDMQRVGFQAVGYGDAIVPGPEQARLAGVHGRSSLGGHPGTGWPGARLDDAPGPATGEPVDSVLPGRIIARQPVCFFSPDEFAV